MAEAMQQGHLYQHGANQVLALESGPKGKVMRVLKDAPWCLQGSYQTQAKWLTPLPMRYFHGATPK